MDSAASQIILKTLHNSSFKPGSPQTQVRVANGTVVMAKQITHRIFGDCLYLPSCPVNLISWSRLRDCGWNILSDMEKDIFIVTKSKYRFIFTRQGGLYQCNGYYHHSGRNQLISDSNPEPY